MGDYNKAPKQDPEDEFYIVDPHVAATAPLHPQQPPPAPLQHTDTYDDGYNSTVTTPLQQPQLNQQHQQTLPIGFINYNNAPANSGGIPEKSGYDSPPPPPYSSTQQPPASTVAPPSSQHPQHHHHHNPDSVYSTTVYTSTPAPPNVYYGNRGFWRAGGTRQRRWIFFFALGFIVTTAIIMIVIVTTGFSSIRLEHDTD